MSKKLLSTLLTSVLATGLMTMNVQAHDGDGAHVVMSASGPVKSASGCVTSSGTGGGGSDACGGEAKMAAPAMAAPAPAMAAPAPMMAAPAPVMAASTAKAAPMMAAKVMGGHSHAANHCTRSMMHVHAGPAGHSHRYSCKGNKMASPRQMR